MVVIFQNNFEIFTAYNEYTACTIIQSSLRAGKKQVSLRFLVIKLAKFYAENSAIVQDR